MDSDIKVVFGLLLYFLVLTFIITMVANIAANFGLTNDGYTTTGGANTATLLNGYADLNRFADTPQQFGQGYEFTQLDKTPRPYMQLGYIYDQTSCEEFAGFTWETTITGYIFDFFGWSDTAYTCTGSLDFATYDTEDVFNEGIGGRYSIDPICLLPILDTSRALTAQFKCSWYEGSPSSVDYDLRGVSGINTIWESLKDIATLRIDFGLTDTDGSPSYLNYIVNFLVVLLPAILLLVNLIYAIRRIVGFN